MAPAPRRDESTGVKPGALTTKRRDQQLPGSFDPRKVGVDLFQLLFPHRSPSLSARPPAQQRVDLSDREPGLLQEGDGRQSLQYRRVVMASAADPSGRRDQTLLLVIAEGRAAEARRFGDLADAEQILDAEATCCPFLAFSVDETPDLIVTELRLPEELPAPMRTLILELIGIEGDRDRHA